MAETKKITLCDGSGLEIPEGGMHIPAALSKWMGPYLMRAAIKFRTRFEEQMGEMGLKAKHFGVLTLLKDGPRSQVEIGRDLLVDRSTMVALIDDLVRVHLVEREPHPEDRRAYAVTLTVQGRRKLPELTALADATEGEFLGALSAEEQRQLKELLARLI